MAHDETRRSLRRDVVFHQLDDLNALGDALTLAVRDDDSVRSETVLACMDRFAVTLGWQPESAIPLVLAYVKAHVGLEDDLFAPAFVLNRLAPDHEQTTALLDRLAPSVRELLALATRRSPPRP